MTGLLRPSSKEFARPASRLRLTGPLVLLSHPRPARPHPDPLRFCFANSLLRPFHLPFFNPYPAKLKTKNAKFCSLSIFQIISKSKILNKKAKQKKNYKITVCMKCITVALITHAPSPDSFIANLCL